MKKETPQDRYARKYKKQFSLPCFTTTEQDIIDKLESVPNKSGYIKKLIREDIKKREKPRRLRWGFLYLIRRVKNEQISLTRLPTIII